MSKLFVGIDPGLGGAIAVIDSKARLISLQDTPTLVVKKGKSKKQQYVESEMASILMNAMQAGDVEIVGLENVHAMPKQGVTSMFSMGTGFGIWLGVLAALRIPYARYEPARWKAEMGLARGADKAQSVILAQRSFPGASLLRKKDHGRAEALLIALYARKLSSTSGSPKSGPGLA